MVEKYFWPKANSVVNAHNFACGGFCLGALNIRVDFKFSEKSIGNKSLIASFTFGTK